MNEQKILITGSSGFLGCNLTSSLQQKGFSVIGLDICQPKFIKPNQFIQADIRDESTLRELLKNYKPAAIFHLAAISTVQGGEENPKETFSVNFKGTCAIFDSVKAVKLQTKIFFASTDKVYGKLEGVDSYTEDLPLRPLLGSVYDCSKAAADDFVRTCENSVVLRFCNLYGSFDTNKTRVVPATILALLEGRLPVLNRYSDSTGAVYDFYRDMLYIEDLCESLANLTVKTLTTGIEERVFNFGVEDPVSIKDLIFAIMKLLDFTRQPEIKIVSTAKELNYQSVNSSLAQKVLGFKPKTSLEQGLIQTIKWWKNFKLGDKK